MNRRIFIVTVSVLSLLGLSAFLWLPPVLESLNSEPMPVQTRLAPTPTASTSRIVRIHVRDAESGEAIAAADVRVGHTRGTTDGTGQYAVPIRRGSSVPVVVQLTGYETWQGEVDATAASEGESELNVPLLPNALRGQVVGHQLVPLPGATVTLDGKPVVLDEEGRFVLRRVNAGEVMVASHPGYAEATATVGAYPTLYFVLEPTHVPVRVRDAMTGVAVPDASVCGAGWCQSTDQAGSGTLVAAYGGLPVTAERQGYQAAQAVYAGQEVLEIELRPAELYGYVRDIETGEPITRVVVLAGDQIAPLDDKGMFHVTDLFAGDSLFVKSPGYDRVSIPLGPDTRTSDGGGFEACRETMLLPCAEISLSPFAVRGLYASYNILVWDRQRMLELIDLVDSSPILNAIVVDIKGDFGYLAFESEDPLIASVGAFSMPRLPVEEFLRICKEKGIYTVARMVVFKDSPLVAAYPELAVRHPNGEIFYDREGMAWADPMREEVWAYNIAVTMEAIRLGFDEVQYDYLRFPSDSTSLEVVRALVYKEPSTIESRTQAIAGFVKAAKAAVDRTHAFLSADIFGYALVIAPEHDMRIGQRIIDLAPHVDYVCPMIYPSTFEAGNLGLAKPSDHPYEVIKITMAMAHERTDTPVRPWLQHYWYERHEITEQMRAAEEMTDMGWCFWNARGTYDETIFSPP